MIVYLLGSSDEENGGCCSDKTCTDNKTPAEVKSEQKQDEISKKEAALWLNLSAARLNQDKRSEAAQAAQHAVDVDTCNPKGKFNLELLICAWKVTLSSNFSLLSIGQSPKCIERLRGRA